jgi:Tol biopolymer transport system component/DNA-binding winged helix-turn-helix (wHTH) protein
MKLLYKFGRFTIDKQNKLLLKDERPVQLKPKVFDTLLVLVEGKGNVLTKDDLMGKIWAETAVEENNLQQNISLLRKILGDTEEGEQYIETIPRRGYRFVARVEEIADDESLVVERRTLSKITIDTKANSLAAEKTVNALAGEPVTMIREEAYIDAATTTASEAVTRTQVSRRAVMAGAVVAVVLMGVAAWRFNPGIFNTPRGNRDFVLKQSLVLGLKMDGEILGVVSGKLSPNGKMVAYTIEGLNNSQNISVKVINNDHVLPVTKEPNNNWCPIWSADNNEIAFLSDRDGETGLWRVSHVGGAATLVHHFTPYAPVAAGSRPRLTFWSEDAKTIYYEWHNNFFALDVDTKEVKQWTDFDPIKSPAQDFCLSPDQQWIAYTSYSENQTDLWRLPAKGGAPERITNDALMEDAPVWSADGESLIYTSSQEGNNELRLFDIKSKESVALLSGMEAGQIYDISRDRSKILYRSLKDEADIWKVMVASGEDTRITSDVGVEYWADVSPDGTNIAFQAMKGSALQMDQTQGLIVTKPLTPDGQKVQVAASASQAQWSPDGKALAYLQREKGGSNLRVVTVIGGKALQVSEGEVKISGFDPLTNNHINDYSWSPDSSKLAYISRKDGVQNLAIAAADGSGEVKLSNHSDEKLYLANPFWSPDGRRIAYVSDDLRNPESGKRTFKVWVASPEKPEISEMIFQSESHLKLVGWAADNELIVGLVDKKEKVLSVPLDVELYRLSDTSSQKLTTLKQVYSANLRLSPDKKTIAFVAIQDRKSNIFTYTLKGGETKQITRNTDATIFFSSLDWASDGAFICYGKQERMNSFTIIDGFK